MLGKGLDEKQPEAAPDLRVSAMVVGRSLEPQEHWTVKTISVTRARETMAQPLELCLWDKSLSFCPQTERGQPFLPSSADIDSFIPGRSPFGTF